MSSEIRDINLAESGEQKIEWVKRNCDLLRMLEEEFSRTKPFAGKKITLSVHLEAKTAYLCKVLAAGGAEMYVTGSNPLSTQDDVAAALVKAGLEVHAWYGATEEEYNAHIRAALSAGAACSPSASWTCASSTSACSRARRRAPPSRWSASAAP